MFKDLGSFFFGIVAKEFKNEMNREEAYEQNRTAKNYSIALLTN